MRFGKGDRRVLAAAIVLAIVSAPMAQAGDAQRTSVRSPWGAGDLLAADGIRPLVALARRSGKVDVLDRILAAASAADGQPTKRFAFAYTEFVHDLSGDGRPDELVTRMDTWALGEEADFSLTFTALEGDTGNKLWTYRAKRGRLSWPLQARVGPRGRDGLLFVELDGWQLGSTEVTWIVKAVDARGNRRWSRAFSSPVAGTWPFAYAAPDLVVSISLFDGLPGRPTDVLIGRGQVARPTFATPSGSITAFVIDGRDAEVVRHPVPVAAVGMIPFPVAVGDIDLDGLDDYAFATILPSARPGGEGEEPVVGGTGALMARTGLSGLPSWIATGFDFVAQNVLFTGPADFIGDRSEDMFVETTPWLLDEDPDERTYLVDGGAGEIAWIRPGQWPYSPGDVNGDGRRDFLTQTYWSGDGYVATRVWAHTTTGSPLWKKTYRTKHPLQTCCSFLIHFGGSWGVGDHNSDGLIDGGIDHWAGNAQVREIERFVIDSSAGRVIMRGDETLFPIRLDTNGGSSDHVFVRWVVPGNLSVEVRDTKTGRVGFSSELGFDLPLDPKGYDVWVGAAHVDGDRCADLAITVNGRTDAYEVILDGGSGKVMWARSLGTGGHARLVSATDSNARC